jgi:hypothetical protein
LVDIRHQFAKADAASGLPFSHIFSRSKLSNHFQNFKMTQKERYVSFVASGPDRQAMVIASSSVCYAGQGGDAEVTAHFRHTANPSFPSS